MWLEYRGLCTDSLSVIIVVVSWSADFGQTADILSDIFHGKSSRSWNPDPKLFYIYYTF